MIAALVHLAHARAAAATAMPGVPNTAAYTQLATKMESLIHSCLQPNILPDIARRVWACPAFVTLHFEFLQKLSSISHCKFAQFVKHILVCQAVVRHCQMSMQLRSLGLHVAVVLCLWYARHYQWPDG